MKKFLLFLFVLAYLNCSPKKLFDKIMGRYYENYHEMASNEVLTDELVEKYIRAVKRLHAMGSNLPEQMAQKSYNPLDNPIYKEIESIIKEEGFANLQQFIMINAKVAWAWNVSQGEIGMQKFTSLQENSDKILQDTLANPDVPEEVKAELEKIQKENRESFNKNKKYAHFMLDLVKPLTNQHDLQIIKKHQKELMEAFTGRPYLETNEIDPKFFITETEN